MSKSLLTLIAIGNQNRGDDGIGIAIVENIKNQLPSTIDVQLWESRDALSVAAELLAINMSIIIVDCADMGLKGGEYKWFKQSECVLEQHHNVLSTHGFGFSDALALAETLGFEQDLYFFAVQAVEIEFKQGLSDILQKNMNVMSDLLLEKINNLISVSTT
ncbi:hydrogenase maturation protease [sulfur-oxidizing endosymbiont of Gigantopelta aegis]|uniref:hydrogenase maturation protease n=1 Tax=sulfur-oxidizing endosymbiont of Gigantopelta aegis TaxID=2794934 RepID=UPI0018DB676F|nr:hydrogenase maturation protease [sulfur-oxidizing endosymbiont of Gigantopelta aegis]